ncbi:MAG: protease pro-enzyme activation domain-containing protein [Thermomicrobiales bacterium]
MRATACFAIIRVPIWLRLTLLTALLFPGTLLSVRAAAPVTPQSPLPLSLPATRIGRTNATQPITLAAALKPTDQQSLDAFLAALADPASPVYHHYLTPQQFTQRFFAPAARKQVVRYLQAQGLVVSDPGVGALIDATGTVGQVEQAFGVRLSDYQDATGRVFYHNDVTPALPLSIANVTYGIIGLDNAPVGVPLSQAPNARSAPGASREAPTRQSVCAGAQGKASATAYLPAQLATAYHLNDLYALGYHGEGQKIAFLQLADYHDADPAMYQACFGTSVPLTRVLVDGGPTGASQYSGEGEVDLDIETAVGLAPNLAGIYNYMAPNNILGITHIDQRIANDNLAPVVSISWGLCEPNYAMLPINLNAEHTAFEQMAAQGQTVFAGTGDWGSTNCLDPGQGGTHQIATFYPSTDPYVTAVGGTHLTIDGTTSAWVGETVWNAYPASSIGSGGGVSIYWNLPFWQSGPGADTNPSNPNTMRMVPDVTIAGDNQYIIFAQSAWHVGSGTSFGGPFWAAGATLINQSLFANGKTRLGYLNPALYAILRTPAQYAADFYDIITGNNCVDPASTCVVSPHTAPNQAGDLYTTTTGYDLASGIGSPLFGSLATALAANPRSPTIASISPNSGGTAGGNQVTITGTNFVAGMFVFFGSVLATNVVVVSATTITATVPASTAGATDVTVVTPGPAYVYITLPLAYTYGAVNALPRPQPTGSVVGSPGPLPTPRPVGSVQAGTVQPLPPRRP